MRQRSQSSEQKTRDYSRVTTAGLREMRSYLNQIVTSCELLKLELATTGPKEVIQQFDIIAAHATDLSRELRHNESWQRLWADPGNQIVRGIRGMSAAVQHIQKVSHELTTESAIARDLLQIEFAVHRLSKLNEDMARAAAAEAESQAHGSARSNFRVAFGLRSVIPEKTARKQCILIVDDDEVNREILARLLKSQEYYLLQASSGEEALAVMAEQPIDLLLLDVLMPGISGFDVLRMARANPALNDVPVLMTSGMDQIESVAACIELGAEDYILKPVNSTILRARVRSLLERKEARDQERDRTEQLRAALYELNSQKEQTEQLLYNILPREAAQELKEQGRVSPRYFEDVTVAFTDFVSFTSSTEVLNAEDLVTSLNDYFTAFDAIVVRYGLERLKTVGDSYIFLAGIPTKVASHPVDAVLASIEMLDYVKARANSPAAWDMRVGINTGPVISGVVGKSKFAFDVWGTTVNLASRMVTSCEPNRINISAETFQRIKEFFACTARGELKIKGNRWREMYFVDGILSSLLGTRRESTFAMFYRRYREYFQRELTAFPASLAKQHAESSHG